MFLVWVAPKEALQMWEQKLYHIVHYMKTRFGVLEGYYTYLEAHPIIEHGQGSRGYPGNFYKMTTPLH